MTREYFNKLDIDERADVLWKDGVYLDNRSIYSSYGINLYNLDGMYVEVYVSVKTDNIDKIEVISAGEAADLFVDDRLVFNL